MPGFDGTGPRGMGSRTGGGRGFCPPGTGPLYGTYGAGWFAGRGAGRGGGRGRAFGGGRGWYGPAAFFGPTVPPYGFYPAAAAWTPEQEVEFLKNQSAAMEQELEQIRGRIDALTRKREAE